MAAGGSKTLRREGWNLDFRVLSLPCFVGVVICQKVDGVEGRSSVSRGAYRANNVHLLAMKMLSSRDMLMGLSARDR